MDPKQMGELIVRIDERTANMAKRQEEEITKREKLDDRVSKLEGWRNKLVGAYAFLAGMVGAAGIAARLRQHQ